MDSFAKQALDTHNKHRALHQVLPLTYSSSLAKDAQAWAEKIAREGKMKHAENCSDGENIFFASGKSEYGGNEPVERWYSEVEKYDFKKGGWQSGAGHFTQVVWKDSRELGIGKAVGSNGAIYVVGRYRPAGNNLRHFADNVFPAKKGAPPRNRSEPTGTASSGPTQRGVCASNPADQGGPYEERTETVTTYGPDGKKTTITRVTRVVKPGSGGGPLDRTPQDLRSGLAAGKSAEPEKPKGPLKDQALKAHNNHRAKHGVPALAWSDAIARDCQVWADKIAKANCLQHATKEQRGALGENIAMFTGNYEGAGERATSMWYSEVEKYDFKKATFRSGTGHFTQVVWKGSNELGMARAKSPDGRSTYVVARYKPAGNMLGDFDKNVFPAK